MEFWAEVEYIGRDGEKHWCKAFIYADSEAVARGRIIRHFKEIAHEMKILKIAPV